MNRAEDHAFAKNRLAELRIREMADRYDKGRRTRWGALVPERLEMTDKKILDQEERFHRLVLNP